jgi:tripartite-type tricarboxylate transporter receptor subunit TctC
MLSSLVCFAAAITAQAALQAADAQPFPSRPITVIVPTAQGGPSDQIARIITAGMQSSLGQPILIENSVQASGSIAMGRVARAAPDGYTVAIGNIETHVFNGVYFQLDYDVLRNFEAVAPLVFQPMLLVVRNGLPVSDLKTLIDLLQKNPGKLTAATGRFGSPSHLAHVLFQRETGTRFKSQPYPGVGPALASLIAGTVDFMIDQTTTFIPHVRDGRVKAVAIMARNRATSIPEVPTVDEAGTPGVYSSVWMGLWAPANTPIANINKLNGAVVQAFANPSVRSDIARFGAEIPPRERLSSAALGAHHKAEIDRWWPILRAANIRP